ncbi:hypothetical protein O3G_MSEX011863 [Manduca sexta]|uniref:C2H2-type domain-containing protein n=1 Tax=Manduca sexta TaxID=7130 RepID=A0A921ZLM5_MANSE|nr:hypothetical protein O3G_MSEX011863 [Manduca sexta]
MYLFSGRMCEDYLSFTVTENNDSKKYVCRYCNMSFAEEISLRRHLQTAHRKSNEKYTIKVRNFVEIPPDFKIRLGDMENYFCDVCSKEYPNKNSLRGHINLHHRLRKCPDCDLKFTARKLRMHQHEAHDMQLPTCGICGYKSSIQANVTLHQRRVHMNEKNVSCDQCDMKFFDRMNLARHKISHGTDRKYECAYCHKKYPRLNTLKLHEKIHTKVKDKVCSECGEGFVQKASLNYHMKKHHPEAR